MKIDQIHVPIIPGMLLKARCRLGAIVPNLGALQVSILEINSCKGVKDMV